MLKLSSFHTAHKHIILILYRFSIEKENKKNDNLHECYCYLFEIINIKIVLRWNFYVRVKAVKHIHSWFAHVMITQNKAKRILIVPKFNLKIIRSVPTFEEMIRMKKTNNDTMIQSISTWTKRSCYEQVFLFYSRFPFLTKFRYIFYAKTIYNIKSNF